MSNSRFSVRPRADQDLEERAFYYASEGSPAVGHRFLIAAHDTFVLLASQPEMGWTAKFRHPELKNLRVFRVRGFEKVLILYRPVENGIEVLRVLHGVRNLSRLLRREGL